MSGQRAILHQTLLLRRARARVIVRLLHKATGGDVMQWRLVDVIVKRRADLDVLAYAVEQGWIEVAPETHRGAAHRRRLARRSIGERQWRRWA
jgi:hypothetical protein